jgi:hypothetical protein
MPWGVGPSPVARRSLFLEGPERENGIMVDLSDPRGRTPTVDDFVFQFRHWDDAGTRPAPLPPIGFTLRRGAGVGAPAPRARRAALRFRGAGINGGAANESENPIRIA